MSTGLAKQIVDRLGVWPSNRSEDWIFSAGQGRPTVLDMNAAIRRDLVDTMIDLYCDWRTGCEQVWAAYERFSNAPPADRAVAFAAYAAALDREEAACEAYAVQIRLIESRWDNVPARPHRRSIHSA